VGWLVGLREEGGEARHTTMPVLPARVAVAIVMLERLCAVTIDVLVKC
jgi:hypothetical protein